MSRIFSSEFRATRKKGHPDPFPVHTLKRVDHPTTLVHEDLIQRVDERESGFIRAGLGEYGERLQEEQRRFVAKQPLSGAMANMTHILGQFADGRTPTDPSQRSKIPSMRPVAGQQAPLTDDPVANARHIKETSYFLRSDLVGICELPPHAVYTHSKTGKPIKLNHKYAIAILIDQDARTSSAGNGRDWASNSMSFLSYSTSAFIATSLADYIRRLGYPARAHTALNYQVLVPPILLKAGLGEMSRMGDVVLNPFLGPRFKAAVVTTDMPLAVDKPIDFGLQDFCAKCKKCAQKCPAQAISHGDKVMYNGYEKWQVDVKKCTHMRVGNQNGSGCGTCIKVCPWSKPFTPFHRSVNWTMRNVPAARNFGIWADDLLGYGKPNPSQKWWLDLEDVNGALQIPTTSTNQGIID
jgi:reductive dehalogenase